MKIIQIVLTDEQVKKITDYRKLIEQTKAMIETYENDIKPRDAGQMYRWKESLGRELYGLKNGMEKELGEELCKLFMTNKGKIL